MANFGAIVEWVLRLEDRHLSGKTVNLGDGAGLTRFGITSKNHPSLNPRFWADSFGQPRLGNDEALELAKQVYYDEYWAPTRCAALLSDELAAVLMSWAVTSGLRVPVRSLQSILGMVPTDGVMGPITVAAANEHAQFITPDLRQEQEIFYVDIGRRDIHMAWAVQGWVNRARAVFPDLP